MCGIFGIAGNTDISQYLLNGITELKHRGPNAWGISLIDSEGNTRLFADNHTFPELFNLSDFKGRMGIAHARYITTLNKTNLIQDAQPLLDKDTGLVISFNGHLQTSGLREQLERQGRRFQTNNDGELILNYLVNEISKKWRFNGSIDFTTLFDQILKPAVTNLMRELQGRGGYSVVGLLGQYGLFAFRDPHGFRPLTYAASSNNRTSHVFASETTVLRVLGEFETVRHIEAGELIYISPNLNVYKAQMPRASPAFCALEPVYLAAADSILGDVEVDQLRRRLGTELANTFAHLNSRIDVVIPIPDTSIPAASELAFRWRKPLGGIIKTTPVRSFLEPNQSRREFAAKQKYRYFPSFIKNKRVALVDDTIIRGTTMRNVIGNLRLHGASEIHVLVTFPQITHPCFYGIDIPSTKSLIAAQKNGDLNYICQEINADSVNFLSESKIRNALSSLGPLCLACTNGKYIGGIPQKSSEITKQATKSFAV